MQCLRFRASRPSQVATPSFRWYHLMVTPRSRSEDCSGLAQFRSNSSPVSRATPRSRSENCFGLAQFRSNSSPVSDATPRHSTLSNSKICLTPRHPIPTRNGVTNSTPRHGQTSPHAIPRHADGIQSNPSGVELAWNAIQPAWRCSALNYKITQRFFNCFFG